MSESSEKASLKKATGWALGGSSDWSGYQHRTILVVFNKVPAINKCHWIGLVVSTGLSGVIIVFVPVGVTGLSSALRKAIEVLLGVPDWSGDKHETMRYRDNAIPVANPDYRMVQWPRNSDTGWWYREVPQKPKIQSTTWENKIQRSSNLEGMFLSLVKIYPQKIYRKR